MAYPTSLRGIRFKRLLGSRLSIPEFLGGLNLRDAPNEIQPNETPDATNWTMDWRGALKWRKGCTNVVALPATTGLQAAVFYSPALNKWLCIRGDPLQVYARPGDLSGSWSSIASLGSSVGSPYGSFIEFPGNPPKVVLSVSNLTGSASAVYTYDGTTFATVSTTVLGSALALWQNRAWVAGYPYSDANGNPTRLFYSKIGDPATWAAPDGGSVDIRVKDADELTGLGLAGGSLLVFKKRSAYRIDDAATGAHHLLDAQAGCVSPLAVVNFRGRCYTWGADSIYEWDGLGPGKPVGDKARTLFSDPALAGGSPAVAASPADPAAVAWPAICGGVFQDRIVFAYPSAQGLNNDRLLEYDPTHGWTMRHALAGSTKTTICSFAQKGGDLYGAVKNGDVLFKMFTATPGADDGTVFTANYRTPWLEPEAGKLSRIVRSQIAGLLANGGTTTLTMRVYRNYDLSSYESYDLSADLRGVTASADRAESIVWELGLSRAFAFEFVASGAAGNAEIHALSAECRVWMER